MKQKHAHVCAHKHTEEAVISHITRASCNSFQNHLQNRLLRSVSLILLNSMWFHPLSKILNGEFSFVKMLQKLRTVGRLIDVGDMTDHSWNHHINANDPSFSCSVCTSPGLHTDWNSEVSFS